MKVVIENNVLNSIKPFQKQKPDHVFLNIYILLDQIVLLMENAYEYRKNFGKQLALETKIKPDIIVPVPDSGVPAALGFTNSQKLNLN